MREMALSGSVDMICTCQPPPEGYDLCRFGGRGSFPCSPPSRSRMRYNWNKPRNAMPRPMGMGFHSIFVDRHALPARELKLSLSLCFFSSSRSLLLLLEKHRLGRGPVSNCGWAVVGNVMGRAEFVDFWRGRMAGGRDRICLLASHWQTLLRSLHGMQTAGQKSKRRWDDTSSIFMGLCCTMTHLHEAVKENPI